MPPTTKPNRYPAEVFWSDEDEGYIATAPDLPGCSAWGKDEAIAVVELRSAIEAWIEAATKAGNPVPPPSRPADPDRHSGKFLLRVPRELHANLARNAKREDVSLNQYVVYLLTHAYAVRSTALPANSPVSYWLDSLPTAKPVAQIYKRGPSPLSRHNVTIVRSSGNPIFTGMASTDVNPRTSFVIPLTSIEDLGELDASDDKEWHTHG